MNNFEIIKPLLKFDDPDLFYFLQIIQRKKENHDAPSNNKVIRNFYFNNFEYLERKMEVIVGLCEVFNARAMLRLNRRSYKTIAHKLLIKIADCMEQENWEYIRNQYPKVCGCHHAEKEKTWIMDIDQKNIKIVNELIDVLTGIKPTGTKTRAIIPSLNGFHLIISPFNVIEFKEKYPMCENIDIHKDNPTNLYVCEK